MHLPIATTTKHSNSKVLPFSQKEATQVHKRDSQPQKNVPEDSQRLSPEPRRMKNRTRSQSPTAMHKGICHNIENVKKKKEKRKTGGEKRIWCSSCLGTLTIVLENVIQRERAKVPDTEILSYLSTLHALPNLQLWSMCSTL